MKPVLSEEQRRRNGITIRLTDVEMQAITNTAWKNRQSSSSLIRTATFDFIKATQGIDIENAVIK